MNISGLPIPIGSSYVTPNRSREDANGAGTGNRSVRATVANEQSNRLPEERVIQGELLEKRAITNSHTVTNANARIFEFELPLKLRQEQSGSVTSSKRAINEYLSASKQTGSNLTQKNKIDLFA